MVSAQGAPGGQIGLVGVLQTWTRDLRYHPHIHYLVPAGALAADGASWRGAKGKVLLHTKPLAQLFRGKMRAGLRQLKLEKEVPSETWSKPWVVDCRPVGRAQAALKYLAPYVFRVALSNNRLVSVANDQVTFCYRVADTKKTNTCTLPAEKFIARFLQHVLPKGFVKVRYFGLFSPGKRLLLAKVREMLRMREATCFPEPDIARSGRLAHCFTPTCAEPVDHSQPGPGSNSKAAVLIPARSTRIMWRPGAT